MDHNAWSPPGPGKHGYMQVGLGRDKAYFNDGECRHVFVGAGKGFVYCGYYHALRVERLTKEEWATLPSKVRTTYAATTVLKEKTKELRSPQRVLAMYDAGELRAPCVRLQCIEFDTAFYQELVRANDQYFGRAIATSEPAKRRRVSQVDPEETDSDEDVIGTSAKAPAKRAGPNVAITAPPTPSVWPALNTGEITVQQYNVRDASMAIVPSINVNPSTQVPSQPQPPERTTRLSTRMASGTLILRIPGGRAVVQATESDFGGPGYDSVESSVDDDEDDLYVDDSD
ncbi:hypothetical protein FKP32DRAFT_1581536 [Trametes sanguinea]|nr:hypothetical protein FKP32DRAFT_1581536 [Trametes sanguinea]